MAATAVFRGTAATGTALRRIQWVRVTLTESGARCEAVGMGHRRPAACPVSLAIALKLAADGVPLVVRRSTPGGEPA